MENAYERKTRELEEMICQTCKGSGKLNDAEPGDIYSNEWDCPDCKTTGINPKKDKPIL